MEELLCLRSVKNDRDSSLTTVGDFFIETVDDKFGVFFRYCKGTVMSLEVEVVYKVAGDAAFGFDEADNIATGEIVIKTFLETDLSFVAVGEISVAAFASISAFAAFTSGHQQ